MKEILLITRTLSSGGAEKVVGKLSIELSKFYNVSILLFNAERIDYPYEGRIIDLKTDLGPTLFAKIIGNIKRYIQIKKIKKGSAFDSAISFLTIPNILNLLTKRKEKTVISIRNYQPKKKNLVFEWFYGRLLKRANHIVTVSKQLEDYYKKKYKFSKQKTTTIYNMYDIDYILDKASDNENLIEQDKSELKLINIGSLTPQKNQIFLIELMDVLVNKYCLNISLFLLGEGPLENKLKKRTNDKKLTDYIHFLGFKRNPYKYLKSSDVFVFPSLYEGFPNALVEAMICENAILAADCPTGPQEILLSSHGSIRKKDLPFEHHSGFLFESFNNNSYNNLLKNWAEKILYIYHNKQLLNLQKREACFRSKRFSTANIIEEWIYLI